MRRGERVEVNQHQGVDNRNQPDLNEHLAKVNNATNLKGNLFSLSLTSQVSNCVPGKVSVSM